MKPVKGLGQISSTNPSQQAPAGSKAAVPAWLRIIILGLLQETKRFEEGTDGAALFDTTMEMRTNTIDNPLGHLLDTNAAPHTIPHRTNAQGSQPGTRRLWNANLPPLQ